MDEQFRYFFVRQNEDKNKLWAELLQNHEEYSFGAVKDVLGESSFDNFQSKLSYCADILEKVHNGNHSPNDSDMPLVQDYAALINSTGNPSTDSLKAARLKAVIHTLAASSPKTLENLWNFQRQYPDQFNDVWRDFLTDNISKEELCLNHTLKEDMKSATPNDTSAYVNGSNYTMSMDHSYQYTEEGKLKHTIYNINDTGLNLAIVDNKYAIINNETLTFAQCEALEQYFVSTGKWPANIAQLNQLMTKNEKGEDVPLGNKIKEDYPELDIDPTLSSEKIDSNNSNDSTSQPAEMSSSPDNPEDNSCESDQEIDDYDDIDGTYSFVKYAALAPNIAKNRGIAYDEFRNNLLKVHPDMDDGKHSVSRTTYDWGGGFTFSLWPDASARAKDNEISSKNGVMSNSSKIFACHISGGRPPEASLFIPNPKNFTADHAGAILNYFKKMGYNTFELPPATVLGKETFKAFMEASVAEKCPISLKAKGKNGGSDIKVNDIKKLDAFISGNDAKLGGTQQDQIMFLLRWSKQLEGYSEYIRDKKPEDARAISIYAMQYRQRARFELLLSSSENISALINNEDIIKDNVDTIAAKYAVGKAMTNIGNGHLPILNPDGTLKRDPEGKIMFKSFDPTKNPCDLVQKAILAYMKEEKPKIEQKILDKAKDNDTGQAESRYNKALNAVRKQYDSIYSNDIKQIVSKGGVEKNRLDFAWPERSVNDPKIEPIIKSMDTRSKHLNSGSRER